MACCSWDKRWVNQAFSRGSSHFALAGVSTSTKRQAMPSSTAGMDSVTSSSCQFFRPHTPCCSISQPDRGEPTILATGMPSRNAAVAFARHLPGNQ
ncbi:hypothetical protein D3C79_945000 [compost metagenome]